MKGTQHPITDADLNAYVDGEATAERRDEIETYLVAEPLHAAQIETWRRQNEIIRAAFAKVATEPLPPSHLNALNPPPAARTEPAPRRVAAPHAVEEHPDEVPPARIAPRLRNGRMAARTVAAFAAGALVTMIAAELSGTATGLLSQPLPAPRTPAPASALDPGRPNASRAIEAYHTYAMDVVRPVEIDGSKEPFLASWLSRRVGFAIDIPDLSSKGLKLLGGRLTPGEWGPAAFLLYETSGGDRTGLFISRAATHETQRLSLSRRPFGPRGLLA